MFSGSLKAFDATVRTGSIRRASDMLGVAPSSVSRHIAMLEREIGTAVFDRKASGVSLTFAGQLVADYARSVLVNYDTLRTDLNDLSGVQRRQVRLALVESVAASGPIAAMRAFLAKYPTVSFDMRLMPAPQVIEAVRTDSCDIGLTFCAEPDHDLLSLASFLEPIVVLVRADHELAAATEIHLDQLASLSIALPDANFGVRRILDRATALAGIRLSATLSSNVFETLREFVRCGAGVAVLPRRACPRDDRDGAFRSIPLVGEAFQESHIDLIVLRKRRLPRVVRSYVEMLIAEISAADRLMMAAD